MISEQITMARPAPRSPSWRRVVRVTTATATPRMAVTTPSPPPSTPLRLTSPKIVAAVIHGRKAATTASTAAPMATSSHGSAPARLGPGGGGR